MTGRACLVSLVLLGALPQAQQPAPSFRFERPVASTARGPQRLAIDVALLRGSDPFTLQPRSGGLPPRAIDGLADLRFVGTDGRAVPHILVHAATPQPAWRSVRLLPIAATKKASGFEADAGAGVTIDTVGIDGIPPPFLKRFTLEGSGDRARWTTLVAEGTLFDLPAEALERIEVTFAPGSYRYVRLTWDDTNSARVPMPASVRVREAGSLLSLRGEPAPIALERRASEPGRSRYRLKLAAARLPIYAIELDVAGRRVLRQAAVFEAQVTGGEARPVEIGSATLKRVERGGAAAVELQVPIQAPAESELELVVDDGNNPPLEIVAARGLLAELPWIYLESPGGAVTARFGDPGASPPSYDLEAVRQSLDLSSVPVARWGEVRDAAPAVEAPAGDVPFEPGAALDPATFVYSRDIPPGPSRLAALRLDAAALAHSRGVWQRLADVRILDPQNRQVPYLVERRDEPLGLDVTLQPASSSIPELRSSPGHNRSLYRVTLPYGGLPNPTLVLETTARVFRREVQLVTARPPDRRHRAEWVSVVQAATWQHTDRDVPARPLALRLPAGPETEFLLVVDEGDNSALPVSRTRILLPSARLRFFRPAHTPLRLVYGNRTVDGPRYDLALLSARVMGAEAEEVTAGAETGGPEAGHTEPVSPFLFWVMIGLAVIVLLGLIARLVRQRA